METLLNKIVRTPYGVGKVIQGFDNAFREDWRSNPHILLYKVQFADDTTELFRPIDCIETISPITNQRS